MKISERFGIPRGSKANSIPCSFLPPSVIPLSLIHEYKGKDQKGQLIHRTVSKQLVSRAHDSGTSSLLSLDITLHFAPVKLQRKVQTSWSYCPSKIPHRNELSWAHYSLSMSLLREKWRRAFCYILGPVSFPSSLTGTGTAQKQT